MEPHSLSPEEARKRFGLPPMDAIPLQPWPERPAGPPGFVDTVYWPAMIFLFVGPAIPYPTLMLIEGRYEGLVDVVRVYPVALFFGGLLAGTVGIAFGLSLATLNKFVPKLLRIRSREGRVYKSIALALTFTTLFWAICLTVGIDFSVQRVISAIRRESIQEITAFLLAPTFICATIASVIWLPKLSR